VRDNIIFKEKDMEKTIYRFMLVALVMAVGVFGCDVGDLADGLNSNKDSGDNSTITGFTFTPTANLKEGTANAASGAVAGTFGSPAGGTAPFTWSLASGTGATDNARFTIDGASLKIGSQALTTGTYSVRVQVADSNAKTFAKACTLTVLNASGDPALTGTVSIYPDTYYSGDELYANIDGLDGSEDFSFKWQRGSTANGAFTEIQGATTQSYSLTAADVGKYLRVEAGCEGYSGTVTSNAVGPIEAGTEQPGSYTGDVAITGVIAVGKILTADTTSLEGEGTLVYQWLRAAPDTGAPQTPGEFADIPNAGDETYTLTSADQGKFIRVVVCDIISEPVGPIHGEIPEGAKVATPTPETTPGPIPVGTPVMFSCATEDATLYYTMTGEEPTSENSYELLGPITIDHHYTIKVFASRYGWEDSEVLAVSYTITGVDTVDWEPVENPNFGTTGNIIRTIVYGGPVGEEKFVAAGTSGKIAYAGAYEADASWTAIPPGTENGTTTTFGPNGIITRLVYGGGKYVAVGGAGKIAWSEDGIDWTAVPAGTTDGTTTFAETETITGVAYGGPEGEEVFVAVGSNGKIAYSSDGAAWTAIPPGTADDTTTTLYDSGSGYDQTVITVRYGGTDENKGFIAVSGYDGAYSTDGIHWKARFLALSVRDLAWVGDKWIAFSNTHRYTSTDGSTWDNIETSGVGDSLAYGGGKIVLVGSGGRIGYSTNGGTIFTAMSETKPFESGETINAVAYGNGRFVAVGAGGKMVISNWQE
jgi:hypothetical protein